MSRIYATAGLAIALVLAAPCGRAQADDGGGVDVAGVFLLGTGVDTGEAPNNPYALQFGGAGELTIHGFVMGVRVTRSVATETACELAECDPVVNDLRAFGADLGFDWEITLLHLSPRLGVGALSEKDGDRVAAYLEPGGVAEVEVGWFTAGVDLRYRVAVKEADANGFLAYARVGLRF